MCRYIFDIAKMFDNIFIKIWVMHQILFTQILTNFATGPICSRYINFKNLKYFCFISVVNVFC